MLEPIAREWLASARSEYEAYLCSGDLTDGLLRAAIRLAKIDATHRGGIVTGIGVEPTDDDIDDLRALWEVMLDGGLSGLRTPMYLNPEFGEATDLVHGADANIIADDILIQIKTIKKPAFTCVTQSGVCERELFALLRAGWRWGRQYLSDRCSDDT